MLYMWLYISGSQPFETHGSRGKLWLGLWTTTENSSISTLWLI